MRLLIGAIVVTLIVTLASAADVEAGKFRAKHLGQCVATVEEWEAAPVGTKLPYAGVRFYTGDHQRGHSVTFCLTATKERMEDEIDCGSGDCIKWQDSDPEEIPYPQKNRRLPPRLFRDVESLRLAAAPGCFLEVALKGLGTGEPLRRSTFGWDRRWANGVVKHDRSVPEALDDKARWWSAWYVCGGAKTEY